VTVARSICNAGFVQRKDIPPLTTLRFPAAGAIVLSHYLTLLNLPTWYFENLSLGVSFFYVLSGFILYYNYSELKNRTAFWVARVARIWPIHLITCGLVLSCLPFNYILGHDHWYYTLPLNLLLVQAWVPFKGSVFSFNGVAWSLSVEAFFYLSFPLLLILLKRCGWWVLLCGSFSLGLLAFLLAQHFLPDRIDFGYYFPVCRLFEFILGMATCAWWLKASHVGKNVRLWSVWELGSLVIANLFVLVVAPVFTQFLALSPVERWMITPFTGLSFALIIWVFAHQAGFFSRLFSTRMLVQLGEVSFSLYMCHQIVLRFLQIRTSAAAAPWEVFFALYLTISIALSYLLFYLVETPARHLIVNAYRRHAGSSPR